MIYESLKEKNIAKILSEKNNLRLLPEYGDRESWSSLPGDVKQHFKDKADELKDKEVLALPATFNLEYKMNFNFNGDVDIYIDEIELTDTQIRDDWQRDYLYRLRLTEKEMRSENDITVCFERKT